ncbi:hypothetical protein Vi05172_g12415 [Venturia inaequalis]|nr:hypothetical protein Vi05172_g12415 [Venturia inaequalis]
MKFAIFSALFLAAGIANAQTGPGTVTCVKAFDTGRCFKWNSQNRGELYAECLARSPCQKDGDQCVLKSEVHNGNYFSTCSGVKKGHV